MTNRCEHCNTLKDLAVSWSHELNAKDEDAVTAEVLDLELTLNTTLTADVGAVKTG